MEQTVWIFGYRSPATSPFAVSSVASSELDGLKSLETSFAQRLSPKTVAHATAPRDAAARPKLRQRFALFLAPSTVVAATICIFMLELERMLLPLAPLFSVVRRDGAGYAMPHGSSWALLGQYGTRESGFNKSLPDILES